MDARTIEASLLKARESVVEVGRLKFTVRRPTQMQDTLRRGRHRGDQLAIALESVREDVIGWEVKEVDIKRDGADVAVPFDRGVYEAFIADRPDLWLPIHEHILKATADHAKQVEALKGN